MGDPEKAREFVRDIPDVQPIASLKKVDCCKLSYSSYAHPRNHGELSR